MGDISRSLAHAIRNPLNTLGLLTDKMIKVEDENRRQELAIKSRRHIRRIDHWIRSFMVLAREQGCQYRDISLKALLKDVALDVQHLTNIEIHLDCVEQEDFIVSGIETELKTTMHALIMNAAEASGENDEVVLLLKKSNGIDISIIDQGHGIAPDILNQLTSPHVSTKASGSGMGVYLAHRIISQRYKGTLNFESNPTGTTVNIHLKDREES